MEKHKITFSPSGIGIKVGEGENLLQAAMEAGIHINHCHCEAVFSRGNPKPMSFPI